MVKFTAEMFVDSIGERGEYDQKIELRADANDADVKYPQHVEVVVKRKKFDLVPDSLTTGTKVKVELYPSTRKGVGKTTGRPFSITELVVVSLSVVQAAPSANDSEELPF
jgi:hypothetical protein